MRLSTTEELQRLQCQYYRLVNGILSIALLIGAVYALIKLTNVILG